MVKQGEKMSEIKKTETTTKKASPTPVAKGNAPTATSTSNMESKANIEALQAQLKQAQSWVKESQVKAQEATAAAEKAIKERVRTYARLVFCLRYYSLTLSKKKKKDEANKTNNSGEATRLANVAHAFELELKSLRVRVRQQREEILEAGELIGKLQTVATVLSHQLELARHEDESLVSIFRNIIKWSNL